MRLHPLTSSADVDVHSEDPTTKVRRVIAEDMQNTGLKGECLPAQIPQANTYQTGIT